MDIEIIWQTAEAEIKTCAEPRTLEELKVKYLGRKGIVAGLTGSIPALLPEQRGVFGQQVNELKNQLVTLLVNKQKEFGQGCSGEKEYPVDISLPGIAQQPGRRHPLTLVIEEICDIFKRMGFVIVDGPEIESEYNNFTGLNIPLEHPSREAFDTFYLNIPGRKEGKYLLRSQTSPVQIRTMKAEKPPLAVIAPGRVYRPDAVDAAHSFMFHQIEGFMVDDKITFSDLKGVLEFFARGIFGEDIRMRFRPHFFPFTEPSAEMDISCIICEPVNRLTSEPVKRYKPANRPTGQPANWPTGQLANRPTGQLANRPTDQPANCPVCHGKGWLEVLGSGMIHPNVFKNVGYDPKKYSGFAFGMGVERIAMLKYGIDDIRLFCENDLRFLRQF